MRNTRLTPAKRENDQHQGPPGWEPVHPHRAGIDTGAGGQADEIGSLPQSGERAHFERVAINDRTTRITPTERGSEASRVYPASQGRSTPARREDGFPRRSRSRTTDSPPPRRGKTSQTKKPVCTMAHSHRAGMTSPMGTARGHPKVHPHRARKADNCL